jgi:TRAP-type C4-dicarboxylate transport system permease small subunit
MIAANAGQHMPKWYNHIEELASNVLLAVITALVFVAAISRTFGAPLIWSVDLAQILFIWLCFLGANRAMRLKAHIGVDMLIRNLPRTPRWLLELALGVIAIAFLMALAVSGYQLTVLNWERIYGDSGIRYAWVTGAVPVGCLLMSITVLANMIRTVRNRQLVFYPERSNELDRTESQLG